MKKCLIFLEKNYEELCLGLLKAAEDMYGTDCICTAVSLNADVSVADGWFDKVIQILSEQVQDYDIRAIAGVMGEIHNTEQYDSILILATHRGRMLAPRLAMRLDTGLVADVTEITRNNGRIQMVRPAFSGKIMAAIENTGDQPIMMSVRPGVFMYENTVKKSTELVEYQPKNISVSGIELVQRCEKPVSEDIRDSRVLVSGGGGILKDFDKLDELAKKLGGMKAASRKVVDSGKADRNIQVGQSGKIVHPDLYIALGIYGALQHVAGLHKVKHIISVNTNPQAPICSLADISVEGDARTFVEMLIAKIDSKQ